ncbi:hypothetical protein BDZ88DRAFT_417935 [Geranomyces variabilis]|nr:hypothetical protein BDZ88DRAFT_417935 [Geranomyces variabilis]KAJ3138290.1 dihydrofolate reductase [Geranomyces variabilis]
MSSESPKFFVSQLDIDSYRWKGQWALAESRARKKSQKYRPGGSSYDCLVAGEAQLNLLLRHYLSADTHVDNGLGNDGGKAFVPLPLDIREGAHSAVEGAMNFLKLAVEKAQKDRGPTDHRIHEVQQADTWMAWAELYCGRTAEALRIMTPHNFSEAEQIPMDTRPYVKVMLLAALTVKAMVLHMAGRDDEACTLSRRAVTFFAKHAATPAPVSKRSRHSPHPDVDQWMRWFEASHHFHTLITSKLGHTQESLACARTYLQRLRPTPDKLHLFSKIAVLGTMLRLLSNLPASSPPPLPLSGIPAKTIPSAIPSQARTEMRQILPYYEQLVTTVLPFPRGEDVKPMETERHARVQECYDWHVFCETYTAPDESLGDIADRHYRLIQSLYRGTKHTFHSMRLLRYMAHTFVSLISLFGDNMPDDEKTEAEAAMESYVFYWDKQYKARLELDKKDQVEVKLERESMEELRSPSPVAARPVEVLEDRLEEFKTEPESAVAARQLVTDVLAPIADELQGQLKASAAVVPPVERVSVQVPTDASPEAIDGQVTVIDILDGERIVDVVGVLFAGVRMLCHNAEGRADTLKRAVGYAERAVELLSAHGASCGEGLGELQHSAYRWLGVACGEFAQEVREHTTRDVFQTRALDATKRALDLKPHGWEIQYQRGMQLSEAGELAQAISLIRGSLERNRTYAPSWNLLALLLGASNEYAQGLKVCEVGIKECIAKAESTAIPTDILTVPGAAPGGTAKWSWDAVDLMEKEDLLNLALTQIALEGHHLGPARALATLKKTLSLARKLFGPLDTDSDGIVRSHVEATNGIDESIAAHAPPMPAPGTGTAPPDPYQPAPLTNPQRLEVPTSVGSLKGIGSIRSRRSSKNSASVRSRGTASSYSASPSTASLGDVYRFRVHDLFVCVHLTASSLHRVLGQLEEADAALREAEKLAATMAQMDAMLRRLPSRLYQEFSMGETLKEHGRFRRMIGRGKGLLKHRTAEGAAGAGEFVHDIQTWGPVGTNVKRVVADVAFEGALIRQALYDRLNTPPPKPQHEKYLMPIQRIDAERAHREWQRAVKEGVPLPAENGAPVAPAGTTLPAPAAPTPALVSDSAGVAAAGAGARPPAPPRTSTSISRASGNFLRGSNNNVNGVNGVVGATSTVMPNGTSGERPVASDSGSRNSGSYPRINGDAGAGSANMNNSSDSLVPSSSTALAFPPPKPDTSPLTLASLVDAFARVTDIDDDHLPARVHLGILYARRGTAIPAHTTPATSSTATATAAAASTTPNSPSSSLSASSASSSSSHYSSSSSAVGIAAHYLERAAKSSKARGCGGGKSGCASWYGGASARWTWDCWRWLARCHRERGRAAEAAEAMERAIAARGCGFPRGIECLKRMVNSDL